jgi:hypothetical protein
MAAAYLAIERASRLVLDYGDVMDPVMPPQKAARKGVELARGAAALDEATEIAETIPIEASLVDGEKELWRYSSEVLAGLSDYLSARQDRTGGRVTRGEAAIAKVTGAIDHIRRIDLDIKGTWGAYDLEWMREIWLNALRRGLDTEAKPAEELL